MKRPFIAAMLALAVSAIEAREPGQPEPGMVRVFVPPAVLFEVPNVSAETISSDAVTVSFDSAALESGQALLISVRADGDLTMPGGSPIPATSISWTTANAANGVGLNGTLSRTVYTPVYQSNVGATAGSVSVTWKLAPPGSGIQAGTRQAALRWRFEAITP
jgi:hypothetical protein